MSRQPRIEELSDSDSDPAEMDPSQFDPNPSTSTLTRSSIPSSPPPSQSQSHFAMAPSISPTDHAATKHYQCLYPLYFDSSRSRARGRRIPLPSAVANPLAREIAQAAAQLGLATVFEPAKTHPKDWANPGRVRVLLHDEGGRNVTRGSARVENKHHLYILVAKWLRAHPTTVETPLKLRVAGMEMGGAQGGPVVAPAVPRGWRMGSILPLHSPALSGGGVSENLFKDMMAELKEGEGVEGKGGEGKRRREKRERKKG